METRFPFWTLQDARTALGLPPATFHITIGFSKFDIHGLPKDSSTLIDPPPDTA